MTQGETAGQDPVAAGPPGQDGLGGQDELPDLRALDLAALRTVDHPVLAEVLADLRARVQEPTETLWGFTNAF